MPGYLYRSSQRAVGLVFGVKWMDICSQRSCCCSPPTNDRHSSHSGRRRRRAEKIGRRRRRDWVGVLSLSHICIRGGLNTETEMRSGPTDGPPDCRTRSAAVRSVVQRRGF